MNIHENVLSFFLIICKIANALPWKEWFTESALIDFSCWEFISDIWFYCLVLPETHNHACHILDYLLHPRILIGQSTDLTIWSMPTQMNGLNNFNQTMLSCLPSDLVNGLSRWLQQERSSHPVGALNMWRPPWSRWEVEVFHGKGLEKVLRRPFLFSFFVSFFRYFRK